ncbi:MAG TPA: BPSS1780 family membrane protein [Luteitalea sp.]|nr:BPSS1780 family membrane protein [Luteitalea sp.]
MTFDNPFQPPASTLDLAPPELPGALITDGRTVPASRGWQWVRDSFTMVAAAPLTWAGITVVFFLLAIAISILPIVSLLWNVGMPILLGGLMLGCHAMTHGEPIALRHMFSGFEAPRLQNLAMVGVLYLAATVVMVFALVIVGVGGAFGLAAMVGTEQLEAQPLLVGSGMAIIILLAFGLGAALSMTIWFAPALVALHNIAPLEAMRMSLRGSLRNMVPFLVYGVLLLLVLLVAGCVGGGFAMAIGFVLRSGAFGIPEALIGAAITSVVVGIAMAPTVWCAMYASYRDVFVG